MFGNLMNNRQIIKAYESGEIGITPWNQNELKSAYYPLTPKLLFKIQETRVETPIHDFGRDRKNCSIPENGYVIVEIAEQLKVAEGIIGQFIPSSNLIEQGFGLTAGRLEHPYGQNGEPIRFGLRNLLPYPSDLYARQRLAYVMFYDLRGLNNIPIEFTEREWKLIAIRMARARDDGPFYVDD